MKRKITDTVFAVLLCILLVIGCSMQNNEKENKRNVTGQTEQEAKNPFGAYDHTVTVTSSLQFDEVNSNPRGVTPEDNSFTQEALERLNIRLKWSWVAPEAQYKQRLKVAVASGELPDFLVIEDKELYRELLEKDEIMPWNEVLDYASESFREWLFRDPDIVDLCTNEKGEIMALPQYWDPKRDTNLLMIREDWLQELGLEVPKTVEELEEAAIAFQKKTGAGHGLALTHEVLGKNVGNMSGLLNMFGSYPGAWIEQDGELVPGEISPETRKGLEVLNHFYEEGILDKRFPLYSNKQLNQEVLDEKLGIVIAPFWEYDSLIGGEIAKNQDSKWTVAPIPVMEGTKGAIIDEVCIEKYWVLSKKCENPEAVVKLFNLFVDFETTYPEVEEGDNGFIWQWTAPQYFDPYDIDEMYEAFNQQISKGDFSDPPDVSNWLLSLWGEAENYYKWKEQGGKYPEDNRWGKYLSRIDKDGAWGVVRRIAEEGQYEVNHYYGILDQDISMRKKVLDQMTEETFVKIVMGESPIEEFDRYAENWLEAGGREMMKSVNDWYEKTK